MLRRALSRHIVATAQAAPHARGDAPHGCGALESRFSNFVEFFDANTARAGVAASPKYTTALAAFAALGNTSTTLPYAPGAAPAVCNFLL